MLKTLYLFIGYLIISFPVFSQNRKAVVENFTISSPSAYPGDTITASFTVRNTGSETLPATYYVFNHLKVIKKGNSLPPDASYRVTEKMVVENGRSGINKFSLFLLKEDSLNEFYDSVSYYLNVFDPLSILAFDKVISPDTLFNQSDTAFITLKNMGPANANLLGISVWFSKDTLMDDMDSLFYSDLTDEKKYLYVNEKREFKIALQKKNTSFGSGFIIYKSHSSHKEYETLSNAIPTYIRPTPVIDSSSFKKIELANVAINKPDIHKFDNLEVTFTLSNPNPYQYHARVEDGKLICVDSSFGSHEGQDIIMPPNGKVTLKMNFEVLGKLKSGPASVQLFFKGNPNDPGKLQYDSMMTISSNINILDSDHPLLVTTTTDKQELPTNNYLKISSTITNTKSEDLKNTRLFYKITTDSVFNFNPLERPILIDYQFAHWQEYRMQDVPMHNEGNTEFSFNYFLDLPPGKYYLHTGITSQTYNIPSNYSPVTSENLVSLAEPIPLIVTGSNLIIKLDSVKLEEKVYPEGYSYPVRFHVIKSGNGSFNKYLRVCYNVVEDTTNRRPGDMDGSCLELPHIENYTGDTLTFDGYIHIPSHQGDIAKKYLMYNLEGAPSYKVFIKELNVKPFNVPEIIQGIAQNEFVEELSVSPNPTSSVLKINNIPIAGISKVSFLSVQGVEVLYFTSDFENMNVNLLPSGMYLVKVVGQEQTQILRMIKQ